MKRYYYFIIALLFPLSLAAQNRYIEISGNEIVLDSEQEYTFKPNSADQVEIYRGTSLLNKFGLPAEVKVHNHKAVAGLRLDRYYIPLLLNESAKITATVLPETAINRKINWESSSPNIVSVDPNGNVKALTAGFSRIRITTEDGNILEECIVSAYNQNELFDVQLLESVATINTMNIIKSHLGIGLGDAKKLVDNRPIKIASGLNYDKTKALCDELIAAGCTVQWGNGPFAGIYSVILLENGDNTDEEIETVKEYLHSSWSVAANYFVEETPLEIGNTWSYFQAGQLSGLLQDAGADAIRHDRNRTGVYLREHEISLYKDETHAIDYFTFPKDAINKNVSWTSENTQIATVNEEGVITGVSAGTTQIEATTEAGNYTAIVSVTVMPTASISFITNKPKGEIMLLQFDAAEADKANCWIDLNNNGKRDAGEDIVVFYKNKNGEYTINSPSVKVYGKFTYFAATNGLGDFSTPGSGIFSLDISNNKELKEIRVQACPDLTTLDVSKNQALEVISIDIVPQLNTVDISKNINLKSFHFSRGSLDILDASKNKNLEWINLSTIDISELKIHRNGNLNELNYLPIETYKEGELIKIINQLPDRNSKSKGVLVLKKPTIPSPSERSALSDKNWEWKTR